MTPFTTNLFSYGDSKPVEQEGTYPLPEAQVDRFMLKTVIDYPKLEEEQLVVRANLSSLSKSIQLFQ